MPALPSKAWEFPLRGRLSPVPQSAPAEPGPQIRARVDRFETQVMACAGIYEIYALCGELKGIGPNALPPHRPKLTSSMKIARILDEPGGTFRLEYDDTLGHKQNTRLDAMSYEQALREARSYLEIGHDNRDSDGTQWDIE
jgi:hypothetical protein